MTRYYMLYDTVFANDDNKDIEHQTDPPLPGFTCMRDKVGGSEQEPNEPLADGRESYTANFYHNRNRYTPRRRTTTRSSSTMTCCIRPIWIAGCMISC